MLAALHMAQPLPDALLLLSDGVEAVGEGAEVVLSGLEGRNGSAGGSQGQRQTSDEDYPGPSP